MGGRGCERPRKNPPPPQSSPESAAPGDAPPLRPGAEVEVRNDDDWCDGPWFEATVSDFSPVRGRARYTITFNHLVADDGSILTEQFAPSHTRPRPPPDASPFHLHDVVEAFHYDGWRSGIVIATSTPADAAATVTVALPFIRDVVSFPPHLVRPRRDYVAGEWVPLHAVVAFKPKRTVRAYKVGEKVEVGRDRKVFGFSWFPATVTKVVDPFTYLVEYSEEQAVEGDAAAEKATEYLHCRFIRPAMERVPRESQFRLGPGAAVEAYCDGAWSPGIVRSAVGDGEFEVSIDGGEREMLVTKLPELLKPQYKWNGKQRKIVSAKRQANLRGRSTAGRSPKSPVDAASGGDEHSHDRGSSDIKKSRNARKRPREESQQQELILGELSVDVSISEMDVPLSALFKSPEINHSPRSGKNNLEVIPNSIGQRVISQEILPEVLLDGQLNTPTCGAGAGNSCDMLSISELKGKTASAHKNSGGQQTQERPLAVKEHKLKKSVSNSGRYKTRPIQELYGEHDTSDNDLDKSLEHTNEEHFQLPPPGFDSIYDAEGIDACDSLLDEELNNGICQTSRNGGVSTDAASIQVAKSSKLMDVPMICLDRPQGHENYQNAGSSHSTVDNSILRRCSVPSQLTTSQISCHQAPFVKTSPAWSLIEGSDVFKLVPQRPHFLPLQEFSVEIYEGMALGLMVALVENIREASIEESMEFFEDKIKTLRRLEDNGFNVQFLQSRLTKMLQIKSNCSEYHGEINKLQAEMVVKTTPLSQMDALLNQKGEAIRELEQQLTQLRQERQQIEKDIEHEDAELSRLKSRLSRFEEACGEGEQQFRNLQNDLRCPKGCLGLSLSEDRLDVSN